MAHHEDEEPDTVEAVIVKVSDALSSARPGAKRICRVIFKAIRKFRENSHGV